MDLENAEDADGDYRLVRAVPVSETAQLMLGVSGYRGKPFGAIRRFVAGKKYSGPTKSGFALAPDVLQVFFDRLTDLNSRLDELLKGTLPVEFCRIRKNAQSELVVSLVVDEKKPGATYLDVRTFVKSVKFTGWTRKGIRVPIESLEPLLAATGELLDAVKTWTPPMPPLFAQKPESAQEPSPSTSPMDDKTKPGVPNRYSDLF